MCGIVGYVGARPALGIVVDGLRRLEYRGYDSAGVAVVGDGAAADREEGRQAGQPGEGARRASRHGRRARHRRRHDRHRAHPLGHPRRPDRPQRPPARRADGRVAVIHNGIIENFAELRAELEADGRRVRQRHRHRGRRAPARRRAGRAAPAGDGPADCSPRRCARVCRRLEGAFTLLAVDADEPGAVVGARRNSPLVVGRGDGRELPGQRRLRVHRAHPRGGRAGPGPGRRLITADGDRDHRLRRAARRRQGLPHRLGRLGRREGRLRLLHAQGDRRAAAGRSPTRCSAGSTETGELVLDEVRLTDQDLRDVDKIFIVACGTAYHAGHGRQVRHRALDPDPVRGRAGQRVPLPRPGPRPVARWSSRSPSPARRWTR